MRDWVVACLVFAISASCAPAGELDGGAPDAPADRDAPAVDATTLDAFDASSVTDAPSTDGGADAPPVDVGPDASWACSIAPQAGCGAGETCRLSPTGGVTPWMGPPTCQDAGTRTEQQSYTPLSCREYVPALDATVDLCGVGLYCQHSECYRYCDPGGPPCPDLRGSPQSCSTNANDIVRSIFAAWGLGTCIPD